MTDLALSLRLAARSLRRSPAFTLAVVGSLGISIAAVTTVFSIADAILFRALPFREPGQLVWIGSVRPQRADGPFSLPEFMDYAQRARTVDLAAYASWGASMPTSTIARRLQGMRISANAFQVLGMTPSAGRLLRPEDDRADAARVVVLSHAFWQETFGGAPNAVGRTIRLNDQPHQIVGVLPPRFPVPFRGVEVVAPLVPDLDPNRHSRGSVNFLVPFGRMRGTASHTVVRQELSAIARDLRAQFPTEYASKLGVSVTSLQDYLVGKTRPLFVVMLGASGLLLLIALANVLNLVLVRGAARRGETAVRRALGGSWRRLAAAGACEAGLLAIAGVALGALLSRWLVAWVAHSSVAVLRIDEARVDGRALLFVTVIGAVATLLFSGVQLSLALRVSPHQALSALGRGLHGTRGDARLRATFLVTQLAFALLITIVTAAMARSLFHLQSVALGYRPDSVLVARVALPPRRSESVAVLARFMEEMERALREAPGVVAAGVTSIAPLSEGLRIVPFSVAGRAPERDDERLEANLRFISPGYFEAISARVTSGRPFTEGDRENAAPVAIISRALARRYFAGTEPMGRQLLVHDNNVGPRPMTVVGIVDDMRHVTLEGPPTFDVYIPMAQLHPDELRFVTARQFWTIRVATAAEKGRIDYSSEVLRTLAAIDREVAVARVEPMGSFVDGSLAPRRFSVAALAGFAATALALAVIGVYGLVAYSVEQRRREIGLRLALGSTTAGVMRTFVQPALALALAGVGIGVGGALLTRRLVAGLLFGVAPTDPVVLLAVATALLVTCAVAVVIPARRAAAIDPVSALRDG